MKTKPLAPPYLRIKAHRFRGKLVHIEWEKPEAPEQAIATCDPPGPNRVIQIDPDLSPKDLMRAVVDEGIHAGIFDIDNEAVDEMSDSISDLLWRIGFRLAPGKP